MSKFEYECALTGLTTPGVEPEGSEEDLPVGWTKIHFVRRQYNPKWQMIQQLKENVLQTMLAQHAKIGQVAPHQRVAIELQIEANFHSLESDTPMYILDMDDAVFLSDGGEVVHSLNEIRVELGLEKAEAAEEAEDEEEESGENSEQAGEK